MEKSGKNPSEIDRLNSEYWDEYYADSPVTTKPSPFATFCLPFMNANETLVDIGCGNGRDSIYFHNHGIDVTGFDICENAIKQALSSNPGPDYRNNRITVHYNINIENVYCRWVLHSMTKECADYLLWWIKSNQKMKDRLFIEARPLSNNLYGAGEKLGEHIFFTDHFRRFICKDELVQKLDSLGYDVIYRLQSNGLSPIVGSNPELIRIVAIKK